MLVGYGVALGEGVALARGAKVAVGEGEVGADPVGVGV